MNACCHHLLYRAGITNPNACKFHGNREGWGLWNLRKNFLPKVIQIQLQDKAKQNQDKTKQNSLGQPNKISAGQI